MSPTPLEDRIVTWPNDWKAAQLRYNETKAHVADLTLQLQHARRAPQLSQQADDATEGTDEAGRPALSAQEAAELTDGRRLIDLELKVQLAQIDVDTVRAEADVRARTTLLVDAETPSQKALIPNRSVTVSPVKLTDSAVEARVKADPQYVSKQKDLAELKAQLAVVKLERDLRQRRLRQERFSMLRGENADDAEEESFVGEDEAESEAIQALRTSLNSAIAAMELARLECAYQKKIGQSLRMLVDLVAVDKANPR